LNKIENALYALCQYVANTCRKHNSSNKLKKFSARVTNAASRAHTGYRRFVFRIMPEDYSMQTDQHMTMPAVVSL